MIQKSAYALQCPHDGSFSFKVNISYTIFCFLSIILVKTEKLYLNFHRLRKYNFCGKSSENAVAKRIFCYFYTFFLHIFYKNKFLPNYTVKTFDKQPFFLL